MLLPEAKTINNFLESSDYIDHQHPEIQEKANQLKNQSISIIDANENSWIAISRVCFEFVRDHIQHSNDFQRNNTTCKASDVLRQGHGFCYAKSHLLAALLRANGIPTALCYQRLTIEDFPIPDQELTYCLHGLNAIYLPKIPMYKNELVHIADSNLETTEYFWYRVDPRGNKAGVDAQFLPPTEQLAFELKNTGEANLANLYAKPLPSVIDVLTKHATYEDVMENLPDIAI